MTEFVVMDCCPITGYKLPSITARQTERIEQRDRKYANGRPPGYHKRYYEKNKERLLAGMKEKRIKKLKTLK